MAKALTLINVEHWASEPASIWTDNEIVLVKVGHCRSGPSFLVKGRA